MIKKLVGHFNTVMKHKWIVFKLCCRVRIPWRGFVHDLSKFSPTEFFEGVKYYVGTHSPLPEARKAKGYSEAYLHHIGRNKHHLEYWMDFELKQVVPVIPYKYIVETVCDDLSAGMVYNGKNWKTDTQYNYWMMKRKRVIVNPKIDNFLTEVFSLVKDNGIKSTLTKKNMKALYKKHCIDDNTQYVYVYERGTWEKVIESEKGENIR